MNFLSKLSLKFFIECVIAKKFKKVKELIILDGNRRSLLPEVYVMTLYDVTLRYVIVDGHIGRSSVRDLYHVIRFIT